MRSTPSSQGGRLEEADPWPAAEREERIWTPRADAPRAPRADRLFREFESLVPPPIALLVPRLAADTVALVSEATGAIEALNTTAQFSMAGITGLLLRTEATASSKIERIYTEQDQLAAVLVGGEGTETARNVAANVAAMEKLIGAAQRGPLNLDDLLSAHRALLADSRFEHDYAGKLRPMQNWIGGSDHSPRGAIDIPPDPRRVPSLMSDLMSFASRHDLPVVAQAGITHAQFEVIHPFTDGNGRIGRALIHATMRRRKLTSRAIVPTATVLLGDTDSYFRQISAYASDGDVDGFTSLFAEASILAAQESRRTATELAQLPDRWRDDLRPRRGSAVDKLLTHLIEHPAISFAIAQENSGVSAPRVYAALDKLEEAGVIEEVTGQKRNRRWVAGDVLDSVAELEERIGRRQRPTVPQ